MKDFYFHAIGERRIPREGDWILLNGEFIEVNSDYVFEKEHPTFTCYEVEVPEDIDAIGIHGIDTNGLTIRHMGYISFSPPKKRVKKWKWEIKCGLTSWRSIDFFSEEEVKEKELFKGVLGVSKIDETMIEVEE